ncbi:MAG: PKD domain-containing protein, partial [Calditrichaceae bacterium]
MPDAQLYYRWDFDNNGIWDTSLDSFPQISHTFTKGGGNRLVRVLVKGAKGLTSTDTINIYVNSRPNIILNWQTDFENSNLIHFDASNSSDYEDGDNLEYRWDFNNDGSWEYNWSDSSEASFEFSNDEWEVKIEAKDTQHLISERIVSGNMPNDAIAYYPFNGNANDESGNGYNGYNWGAILTEDIQGSSNSAYEFLGENYISVNHNSSLNPAGVDFSISIWFQFNGQLNSEQDYDNLLSKGYYNSGSC